MLDRNIFEEETFYEGPEHNPHADPIRIDRDSYIVSTFNRMIVRAESPEVVRIWANQRDSFLRQRKFESLGGRQSLSTTI
jgi:hypothetical protein